MEILYIGTSGRADAVKAALPLHLAVNGSLARGDTVRIVLAGDAADLLLDGTIDTLEPLGVPPLRDLVAKAVDAGVPIDV